MNSRGGTIATIILVLAGWWIYDSQIANHWESISYMRGDYSTRLYIRDDIKFKTVNECVQFVRGRESKIFASECGYRCSGEMNNATPDVKCKNWAS